ncbi:hypothetical protein BZZ01_03555 [Nostocales cyanobacterium HT-58-2]|nr:hypothetical protein BZZ01_03555 [Nostocales cyanobacterium HT-58-2]
MSRANVENFYQELLKDSALQEQLRTATDRDSTAALAVELGKEKGYGFTLEEAQAYIDEINANNVPQGELSDELLESVAGGMMYMDDNCQTNRPC